MQVANEGHGCGYAPAVNDNMTAGRFSEGGDGLWKIVTFGWVEACAAVLWVAKCVLCLGI